jgi:hypothetical protein
MSITYYTVVYRVDGDATKHADWWNTIRPLLMAEGRPVSVTAISKADEGNAAGLRHENSGPRYV